MVLSSKTKPCDLCHETDFESIGTLDRNGRPLATRLCNICGLVAHLDIPSEAELKRYYTESYRLDYHCEAIPSDRRVMRAWINGLRILKQVAPFIQAGSDVFEVGAGIGCTVKVFEDAGFAASGIDPGGEFLKFARQRLGARVDVGDLYDRENQPRHDLVLLIHVIEHLASPRAAIDKIAALLKPDGMLYIECPNLDAPFASRGRLFHVAHIHNFVPSTLQSLLESCGFLCCARFGDPRDGNLQMLFQRHLHDRPSDPRGGAADVRAALRRSHWIPYHFRLRYALDRIAKLFKYFREFWVATQFVKRLTDGRAQRRGI